MSREELITEVSNLIMESCIKWEDFDSMANKVVSLVEKQIEEKV